MVKKIRLQVFDSMGLMFSEDLHRYRIFIRSGFTDMRKSIVTLSILVKEEMGMDPFSESLFLFCGKNRKQIKVLYFDKTGFCLWQKKLAKDKFPWPMNSGQVRELQKHQLAWLLTGIDFFKAHEELKFDRQAI
jgi:transposase